MTGERAATIAADRRRRLSPADAARILLVGLLGAMIGVGLGNAVGTVGDLGPLDVTTRLTTGVGSTFDVGVAAVRLDTQGPLGLSITANDVRFSGPADLAETLTSFGDVEAVASTLLRATVTHLGRYAEAGALVGLLVGLVTHRPWRGRPATQRRRRWAYAAGGWLALGALGTSVIGPSVNLASRSWTPVVGLSVEGQEVPDVQVAGNLLDEAIRVLEQNESFYQQLRDSTAAAMLDIAEEDAERELAVFVFESDLHCNLGMTRVISEVAVQARASFVLSGGDITMSGSQLEALCTDVYLSRLGATPFVLVLGNHDSVQTGTDLEENGAVVMRGEPVSVAGLTLLGNSDPYRSQIGSPTTPRGAETATEFTERTAESACEIEPDILVVHDPAHAATAIEEQCAPLVLSGHRHREIGPTVTGNTVSYTVDNSGGTGENTPSYGPLATNSAVALFYYDPDTAAVVGQRTVEFGRDGSAVVGDYRSLDFGEFNRGDGPP
ncbi:MAG: metallophosphoesterase [Actinomycetota bacterium]|nr:metallophosphoesterase [Actinomycetota bacterium]